MLWYVLLQFICRLTFGLALAMWTTPAPLITSGYYRVHLWVLLGCNTFASLIAWSCQDTLSNARVVLLGTIAAAVASYIGAVMWLYEKPRPGRVFLLIVGMIGLVTASLLRAPASSAGHEMVWWLHLLEHLAAGWLIGTVMAAMFLGHWYLNTPTMQLTPLKRLVVLILVAVVLRALVSGGGLVAQTMVHGAGDYRFWALVSLRWLSGILGTSTLAWMTWQTLKIPNTQSATGILYVGVIFVFLGELTAQLLTPAAGFPL